MKGNPCNVANGNKFQPDTDFTGAGLSFIRYYNSLYLAQIGMGHGWRTSFHQELLITPAKIYRLSTSGRGDSWQKVNGAWLGEGDSKLSLVESVDGFDLSYGSGLIENYNDDGQITLKTEPNGNQITYSYNAEKKLQNVINYYGHSVSFSYENDKIISVTNSLGDVFNYEYDSSNNLISVIYPDSTPGNDSDNPRKVYHYENTSFPNHLTGITDENSDRYSSYSYNAEGKAISTEHSQTTNNEGQEKLTFDFQTNETLVTDAVGIQNSWSFQMVLGAPKMLTKTNLSDNKSITQTWDTNGNLLTRTDPEGRTTAYTYNVNNQKLTRTEAVGTPEQRSISYEYISPDVDLVTKMVSASVFLGSNKESVNTYDANLNVTSVTINGFDSIGSAISRSTTFTHDAFGKVVAINGPRTDVADVTSLEYYECTTAVECGQLKSVSNALGHLISYDTYDDAARLTQSTDANGLVTSYSYHPRGWLLSTIQTPTVGQPRITQYSYDNAGQLINATLPDGSEQNYTYDVAHDLREISDNFGNKITYTYDANGNRTEEKVYDPDGTLVRTSSTLHDVRNFVESIALGTSVTSLLNDAVGNVSTQTDANFNPSTVNSFDALNRLSKVIDALGNETNYQYNVNDQVTQVDAPNNALTSYVYDDLGNLKSESSSDRGLLEYTHDIAGNVLSSSDARGIATLFSYDALNRVTSVDYSGSVEDVTYEYDSVPNSPGACQFGIGRLCEVQDHSGVTTYQYDAFENVMEVDSTVLGQSYLWVYTYNNVNRLSTLQYPNGRTLAVTRDALGRLNSMDTVIEGQLTNVISGRTYRGDGLRKEHTLGNNVIDSRSYDLQGRLFDQTLSASPNQQYLYDANGNITNISGLTNQDYTYDALDRLSSSTTLLKNLTFNYDENGNRLSLDDNGELSSYNYLVNSNKMSSLNSTPISFDAAGNTLSDQSGVRNFLYNQAGRLEQVTINGLNVAEFTYRDNGLRATKVTPNATRIYQYGLDGRLLAESNLNGQLLKEYLYADGDLVAMVETDEGTPAVNSPIDIQIEASDVLTPVSLGTATAFDQNGAVLVPSVNNAGPFPLGQTLVTWSAIAGPVVGRNTQRVNVVDTTPPMVVAPADMSINNIDDLSSQVGQATATDIFGFTISSDLPSSVAGLPYGSNLMVTWTAIDVNGNSESATQTLTLVDASLSCTPTSIAANGVASQSSTHQGEVAFKAINGVFTDSAHTTTSDTNASWQLDYAQDQIFDSAVIHNRSVYKHWLRDLIVSVYDSNDIQVYESQLLNPENTLNSPASIQLDFPSNVTGTRFKIRRVNDTDLSGGGSSALEGFILAMSEVEVQGCIKPKPPTAPQVTTPSAQQIYFGASYSYQIDAVDINNDTLTYSAMGLPSGLSIDSQTGEIFGMPQVIANDTVSVTVSDGVLSSLVSFDIDTIAHLCSGLSSIGVGIASQSSTHQGEVASKAVNGIFTDSAHTTTSDVNASWQLDFSQDQAFDSVVIHNRSVFKYWLRDLIVSVEDSSGTQVYESQLLNPENILNDPATIQLFLPPSVIGNNFKISRVHDSDLSGGGSSGYEGFILAMSEVEIQGCVAPQPPIAPEVFIPDVQNIYSGVVYSYQVVASDLNNDTLSYSAIGLPSGLGINAQTGEISGTVLSESSNNVLVSVSDGALISTVSFTLNVVTPLCSGLSNIANTGAASQSTTLRYDFTAPNAINGIFTDVTHTATSDANASWQLDYSQERVFDSVLIHNRINYQNRLRDILISIEDAQGAQVFESKLLNPENSLNNPDTLLVNFPALTTGRTLKVRRVDDPDLSGGGGSAHDGRILSLAEIDVQGCVAPQGGQ